jgi:tetratricopeptide (TPR) repeat protein
LSDPAAENKRNTLSALDGLIVLIAALAARVAVRLSGEGSMFFNRVSDSFIYDNWAQSINGYTDSAFAEGAYFLGPLYPHLLALLDGSFEKMLNLQTALGVLTALCCWFCAASIYDRKAGIASGLIAAFYRPFLFYENLLLPETTIIFLCAAALVMLLIYNRQRKLYAIAVSGLFFGLACLGKGTILPAAFAIAILLLLGWPGELKLKGNFKLRFAAGGAFIAPLAILLIFPAVHNFRAGETVLLSANGGLNFYLGNNKQATGDYAKPYWLDLTRDFSGREFAEREAGRTLGLKQSSTFYYKHALNEISDAPARWFILMLKKAMMSIHGREIPQAENIYYAESLKPGLKLPWFGWALLLPLALAGLLFDGRQRKETLPLWCLALSLVGVSTIFFVVARFRLPAALALTIPAGAAVATCASTIAARKYKSAIIFCVVIATSALALTIPYPGGQRSSDLARGNLNHAGYFMMQGDYGSAIHRAERAAEFAPDNPWPYSIMGLAYSRQGHHREAIKQLSHALDLQPNSAAFATNLALLYLRAKNYQMAEAYAERAVNLDPKSEKAKKTLELAQQKASR